MVSPLFINLIWPIMAHRRCTWKRLLHHALTMLWSVISQQYSKTSAASFCCSRKSMAVMMFGWDKRRSTSNSCRQHLATSWREVCDDASYLCQGKILTHQHHQSSSNIINHHQPSSTIINHHQPSSIIIKHHQPSSTIKKSSKNHQTIICLGKTFKNLPAWVSQWLRACSCPVNFHHFHHFQWCGGEVATSFIQKDLRNLQKSSISLVKVYRWWPFPQIPPTIPSKSSTPAAIHLIDDASQLYHHLPAIGPSPRLVHFPRDVPDFAGERRSSHNKRLVS